MPLALGRRGQLILACLVSIIIAPWTAPSQAAAARAARTTGSSSQAASVVNPPDDQKRVCLYDHNSISGIATFAAMVHRRVIDCAMVYVGSPDWAGWTDPWFLTNSGWGDLDFAGWVRSSPPNDRRQLIISQPLIPSELNDPNWRAEGAAGDFEPYAVQLAQNLVAAGLGDAIIRLSWEANGDWSVDNIGTTTAEMADWAATWRNTVEAMRSVPGAHFRFDWCVNNGYRNVPFADYYPGDSAVDIIGDDVYDLGTGNGISDWPSIYGQGGGLQALVAFAKAHDKPLSIPEWGLGFASEGQGGDDPSYINNLAQVIKTNDVAYQTYFYTYQWATQLQTGPLSLAAYQSQFGDGGDATGPDNGTALINQGGAGSGSSPASPTATPGPGQPTTISAPVPSGVAAQPTSSKPSADRRRGYTPGPHAVKANRKTRRRRGDSSRNARHRKASRSRSRSRSRRSLAQLI